MLLVLGGFRVVLGRVRDRMGCRGRYGCRFAGMGVRSLILLIRALMLCMVMLRGLLVVNAVVSAITSPTLFFFSLQRFYLCSVQAHPSTQAYTPSTAGPNGAHTRALPQLFLEFHHDITPFTNIPSHPSGAFVLSPGDPTGYGFHADFINGWEGGNRSLADAILPISTQKGETRTKCFVGLTGKEAAECFDMLEPAKVVGCRMEQSRKEDVEGPVKALPGCNAVQGESLQNAVMGKCDGGGGGGGGQQQMGSDQVQSQPQVQASPAASRQRQQRHKRRH